MRLDQFLYLVIIFTLLNLAISLYIFSQHSNSQQALQSLNKQIRKYPQHNNNQQSPQSLKEIGEQIALDVEFGATNVRLSNKTRQGFIINWGYDAPTSLKERIKATLKLILLRLSINYRDWDPEQYLDLYHFKKRSTKIGWINKRDDYCLNSDLYNILNPQNIKKRYISSTQHTRDNRGMLSKFGIDASIDIYMKMLNRKLRFNASFNPKYSVHFLKGKIVANFIPGKQFFCAFQTFDRIVGIHGITFKNILYKSSEIYTQELLKQNMSKCYQQQYLPKSYDMKNKAECTQLFSLLNSKEYIEKHKRIPILLVRKSQKVHLGRGVVLLTEQAEQKLKADYQNGQLCGATTIQEVVQQYIYNPYLIEEHKFDLRIYFTIVSVNPLVAYYAGGFARRSFMKYNISSTNQKSHISNYGHATVSPQKAKQLDWPLEKLQEYLLNKNKIPNRQWLNKTFIPKIKQMLMHFIKMGQRTYFKHSGQYEFFGADLVVDDNLDIWLIEINGGPGLSFPSQFLKKMKFNFVGETLQLVFHMLERKQQRIIEFLEKSYQIYKNYTHDILLGQYRHVNVQKLRKQFQEIYYNDFDQKFEKYTVTHMQKLIDESNTSHKYYYSLDTECSKAVGTIIF